MIRPSTLRGALAVAGLALTLLGRDSRVEAQSVATTEQRAAQALRRQVERRFVVVLLTDGVVMRPRSAMRGIRSIQLTQSMTVDGSPVSEDQLSARLGDDDADLVIQVWSLSVEQRRALFADRAEAPIATPPPPMAERPEGERRESDRRRRSDWPDDDRVHIGGSVRVGPDEVVDGDVVAVGGSAHVEGLVHGDVVSVGGSVELGPRASVDQDVVVIGGSLERAAGARVGGRVKEVGLGMLSRDWIPTRNWMGGWMDRRAGSMFAVVSTAARGVVLCLLAGVVLVVARASVDRISLRAGTEPIKAGAIGLLSQMLFVPLLIITILVLVVTIVGIPLLVLIPFVVLGLGVVGLVGFTAVAHRVGEHVGRRLGWANHGIYLNTFAGVAVILLPVLVARLGLMAGGIGVSSLWHFMAAMGFVAEYIVWTVGFGAVALVRFGRRTA